MPILGLHINRKVGFKMRDRILDVLALEKQEKWEARKKQREEYEEQKRQTSKDYRKMQDARDEVNEAREILNKEFELLKEEHPERTRIWQAYHEKRATINEEIAPLRAKSDEEHHLMNDFYDQAERAYLSGDKEKADQLSQEARSHRLERNRLNAEVKEAINKIRAAKKEAMELAPPQDRYGFDTARERFEKAKRALVSAEEQFSNSKNIKHEKYAKLQNAEMEFQAARDAFEERLKLVRQPQPEEETPKRMSFFSTAWFK